MGNFCCLCVLCAVLSFFLFFLVTVTQLCSVIFIHFLFHRLPPLAVRTSNNIFLSYFFFPFVVSLHVEKFKLSRHERARSLSLSLSNVGSAVQQCWAFIFTFIHIKTVDGFESVALITICSFLVAKLLLTSQRTTTEQNFYVERKKRKIENELTK